mgnify:CR=1 FL=1
MVVGKNMGITITSPDPATGLDLMFVMLFGLKITGQIDFSWWVVTLPMWGPLTIAMLLAFVIKIFSK